MHWLHVIFVREKHWCHCTFFPGVYEEEQVSTAIPTPIKHYSFNGMTIAVRRGGTLRYTHTDHLGSSSGQTDTSGNAIVDSYLRYYAYGTLRSGDPSAATTDRTFTGQKQDGTGLLYYNARYYDNSLGTFLSPDTLVADAGRVVDYQRYLYVRANPLRYSDPTGHDPQCEVGTSACDQEWTLWRQYEKAQDAWSSWEDFLSGYNNYKQYESNPDSYLRDWLVRTGQGEGDWAEVAQRLALAETYSESVLGESSPSFFDENVPLELVYQLSNSRGPGIVILAIVNPLFQPGPNAGSEGSIPATGPRVTPAQSRMIQDLGSRYGCHTCGATEPGGIGIWIGDHQPPNKIANGGPQRLYPQCQRCSAQQGGFLRWFQRKTGE